MQLLSEEPHLTYRRTFLTLKYCYKVSKTRDHVIYNIMFFTNQNTQSNEYVQIADIDAAYARKNVSYEKTIIRMLETDFGK